MMKNRLITIIAMLAVALTAFGQVTPPVVTATLEPDSIAIGDHFVLTVRVKKDAMQMVDFPNYETSKDGKGIEVLAAGDVDTVSRDGRKVELQRKYVMTTFDEGVYHMGKVAVLFADKNIVDTVYTADSLLLKVGTFEIDTTKQQIYDIKKPLRTPVKFAEFAGYLIAAQFILLAIITVILLVIVYRRKEFIFAKPKEPPHVVALRALEGLHHQKVWQSNKHKLYYSAMVDIVREYIEGRYSINAMEMTSEEIIEALKDTDAPIRDVESLDRMLATSDLVKFAKHVPEAEQNEESYHVAYNFVEDTKVVEVIEEEE